MLDISLRMSLRRICWSLMMSWRSRDFPVFIPVNTEGEQQSWEPHCIAGSRPGTHCCNGSCFCHSQLAADPDPNVKSGSELLDRLLKVFLLS